MYIFYIYVLICRFVLISNYISWKGNQTTLIRWMGTVQFCALVLEFHPNPGPIVGPEMI